MFWSGVEKIIGECIPKCIQQTLTKCGYSSLLCLKTICVKEIDEIEKHVDLNCSSLIQTFTCSHAEFYKKQHTFRLLPGHRQFILTMAKTLDEHYKSKSESAVLSKAIENNSCFSVIMKELIKTALENGKYEKNNYQYSDIVRYFATYIFIMCGRASYTVLCKNLPLPSITTIRKYRSNILCFSRDSSINFYMIT